MSSAETERPPGDELALGGTRHFGGRVSGADLAWAGLAAVMLVIGLVEIRTGRWHSPWPVSLADLVVVSAPIAFMPRRPVASASLAAAAFLLEVTLFGTPQSAAVEFGGLVLAAGTARYAEGRWRWPLAGATCVVLVVAALRDPSSDPFDYLFTLGIWTAAAVFGALLRRRHHALVAVLDRAVTLRTERRLAVEQAIQGERSRIARDLHDVVAHAVSLMVVQAAAGRAVVERDPTRVSGVFATIETSGQRALGDLRRLLGLLQGGDQDDVEPPGLAAVDDLAAQADAAGLPCRVTWRGGRDRLPAGIDVAAYRVVQESVTNALKHGSRAGLDIEIDRDDAGLRVIVLDRASGVPLSRLPGSGQGLRGMRERVGLYDGTLAAGQVDDGWQVEAWFPVGAAS